MQSGVYLVLAGLVVHIIFLASIFDIYFTSPLVHGMTPHVTPLDPPARRLVLFVTDGLRADKFFEVENGVSSAPFLRNIMETKGAWGVSHTRVPTESRPGHVALIAGFYEDVSAVAKGWKENPVEFDSVFNESRTTWSWGSPDILPMFAKGASGDHILVDMYPPEHEDFADTDTTKLDTWVFDKVRTLFTSAVTNTTLATMLRQDKIVFFLHLLGLDTCGHSLKPHSKECFANLALVDRGIKEMTEMISKFYKDDLTAFVMTADHGMTDWGSHGAGNPHETLTPLVVWGAGVRGPSSPGGQRYTDGYSEAWKLTHLKRCDVNQADISPLMASLIGVPFPLNSVGILPLDLLNNSDVFKAKSMYTNALQILAQYQIKMHQKEQTTLSVFFKQFDKLTISKQADILRQIQTLIQQQHYDKAISESRFLIIIALDGLNYYHAYDRVFLGTSIVLGFLGWFLFIMSLILRDHTIVVKPRTKLDQLDLPFWRSDRMLRIGFGTVGLVIIALIYIQSLPFSHYIYCLLPVVLWHRVIQRFYTFQELWTRCIQGNIIRTVVMVIIGVGALEIIVLSFFRRELLSLGFLCLAAWPWITGVWKEHKGLVLGWSLSCLSVAIFPSMPVVGREANYSLVLLAGCLTAITAVYCIQNLASQKHRERPGQTYLNMAQVLIVFLATCILSSTSHSIKSKEGSPLINQIGSWLILVSSFLLPMLSSTAMYPRLLSVALALLPPYLLLSTAHEGLFSLSFCFVLFFWLQIEHKISSKPGTKSTTDQISHLGQLDFADSNLRDRKLELADLRCAYFFVFFITAAFFGTGNIASINSFNPSSVYCYLTVFNPFIMGALMLWKIIIPFILVTCVFNAIHISLEVPTKTLFLVVSLMSDFMGMHFFFLVQDHGSWLEIGTSISHYVIVMCMIIFLTLLLGLATALTTWKLGLSKLEKKKI